ncbi:stalk domain-containing protein [Paenibacillus radicis (ex Gao et al. 2016)]|uniref:Copper amine oxidase-like N-terminal domain-containing protein n=1 Tax=Paenibacillus radicis (ex Gao et al. 2016) TaxID=1737354 RepID=A0A917HTH9_9BACL|nr:trypsin-like peptidase domain-containing protein [Paenibacillus radicis (ex Gao et al. 2016)]GGG88717.1 hypothetical protein GCM10010918_54170 [Paenibacillus radicis (ex Gao et al. 2016)]
MQKFGMIALILSVTLFLTLGVGGKVNAAEGVYQVYVDGKLAAPKTIAKDNVTFVPYKDIMKAMGFQISYDSATKTIVASKRDTHIVYKGGDNKAFVNGKSKTMSKNPISADGTNYVPLRFLTESTGYKITKIDGNTHIIYVNDPFSDSSGGGTIPVTTKPPVSSNIILPYPTNNLTTEISTKKITEINDSKVAMVIMDTAQGSAVSLGDGVFVTNYHVIEGQKNGYLLDIKGNKYPIGGVISANKAADLALIKLSSKTTAWSSGEIGNPKELVKGDKVVAIGSPKGIQNTVSEGVISNIITTAGVGYIQISVPIDHGSSGGGLFNDKGQLVGITSMGRDDSNANLNYAVSIIGALPMIQEISGKEFNNITTSPLSSYPASSDTNGSIENDELGDILAGILDKSMTSIPGNIPLEDNWDYFVDEDGTIVLFNRVDVDGYQSYSKSFSYTKSTYQSWADGLGKIFYDKFPDKDINIMIYVEGFSRTYPTGFAPSEITAVDGGYEVTHIFIFIISGGKAIVRQ